MTDSLSRMRGIVSGGLCHRCGACSGICPVGVISPGGDYYPQWDGKEEDCTDCGLCVRVCPGVGFDFPENSRALVGKAGKVDDEHGLFLAAFLGYAADPELRGKATSGGIATSLPLFLLSSGRVKGALVVGTEREQPWKPRAVIAGSREEIIQGLLSKYPVCSTLHLLGRLRDDRSPFVFTGLPCHIHGLRKMASLRKDIGEKAALTIGLLCHSALDHQALRDIIEYYSIDAAEIVRLEYRGGKLPGYIRAYTKRGEWIYLPYPHLGPDRYRPNAKECLTLFFKFYSPPRCRLCIDATSEFADISVGDPWFKGWEAEEKLSSGYSLIIARTERGLAVLQEARDAGALVLEQFQERQVRASHVPMVRTKRMRAFYNIERRRKEGRPVPEYGLEKRFTVCENLHAAFHCATYFSAERPRLRRLLVRILLSRAGRYLVGALFFRRRVVQAGWEKLRRACRWAYS